MVEREVRFSTAIGVSIRALVPRPVPMLLFRQLRALLTLIVLANHTPVAHVDQLGLSLFVGRFTRVAAAQQFDPTRPAVSLSTQGSAPNVMIAAPPNH
jgi:polyisoprenoid-binding protein YceI